MFEKYGGVVLVGLGVAAAIFAVGIEARQDRPDFSGIWKLTSAQWTVQPQPGPDGKPASPPSVDREITIRHSGPKFEITRRLAGALVPVQHVLDSSETRSRTPGRLCRGDSEGTWTAAWRDRDVVITMAGVGPEGGGPPIPNDVRTTLELEAPDRLRVSVDFPVPVTNGQNRLVSTGVYARVGAPSAASAPAPAPLGATIQQVGWLTGTWVGQETAIGTEEIWSAPTSRSMQGIGRVIRNRRLASFEFLCIAERSGGLVYMAMPEGRMSPTEFTLTGIAATGATFENPTHTYPKKIEYGLREDGSLMAVVSGSEKQRTQTYLFTRRR